VIELLLVDDHAVVREGYRRLLERRPDLHVAAEASDAEEALQFLRATPPST
jgi:two-component system invasion response regulator UvrY